MRYVLTLLVVSWGLAFTGCRSANCNVRQSPANHALKASPNRHQIFSPDTEETLVRGDYDTPWPAAVDAYQPLEVIDYRETINDRQNRWGSFEDQYYRRFDSVRSGRLVR